MSLHIAAPTDIISGVEKEGNCTSRLSLLTITGIAAPLLISVIVEAEETPLHQGKLRCLEGKPTRR